MTVASTNGRSSVLFLHSRLSGYYTACINQLAASVEVVAVVRSASTDAPFKGLQTNARLLDRRALSQVGMQQLVADLSPSVVVVSGWFDPEYLSACCYSKDSGIPVIMGIDTPYPQSLLRRARLHGLRRRVQRAADYVWVPGWPQIKVAERLGFPAHRRMTGLYTCDSGEFERLSTHGIAERRKFLFVGRFADVKGVRLLAEAYRSYRELVTTPWDLVCVGDGPQRGLLVGQPGIDVRPFVQPQDIADVFAQASAFVMPSTFEPWGVAIHEAASAGLPLICSDACGAATHLLQDRFNGLSFKRCDAKQLADSFHFVSEQSESTLQQWSSNSRLLASQFSPTRWSASIQSVIDSHTSAARQQE